MFSIKRLADFFGALKVHQRTISREWTRDELMRYQQTQLQSLVRHAIENSGFYKELYKDVVVDENLAITDLPPVNKAVMMENYDRVVTDPRLKLADLLKHIETIKGNEYYLGEYSVQTTSGSTGLRGVFVFNREEYRKAVTTGLRVTYYAGIKGPRFPKRWRLASIGADNPLHVTGRFYRSVDYGFHNQLRLPVTTPVRELVAALNRFQPEFISCYPSLLSLLAIEQIEGRLNIRPFAVSSAAEICTGEMKQNMKQAWDVIPYNCYGLTEAGLDFAMECSRHDGLHIFEDFFIVESVDGDNNPVPDGEPGAKMLFTNLYNYTQPIIRYEVADIITLMDKPCRCGHPFKLISNIEGRSDEIIYLNNEQGEEVPVHPHNLRSPIAQITDIKQYQLIQETDGFHITVSLRQDAADAAAVTARLTETLNRKLTSLGAVCPPLHINIVDELERDHEKMGKFRLIKSNISRQGRHH